MMFGLLNVPAPFARLTHDMEVFDRRKFTLLDVLILPIALAIAAKVGDLSPQ
jgi:hypothetical protein